MHYCTDGYSISTVGNLCNIPVNNSVDCEIAAHNLSAVYTDAMGSGYDLPYGCIIDTFDKAKRYCYWNPNGVAGGSLDPRIQQVCVGN